MQCINCSTVIYSVRVGSALAVMRYSIGPIVIRMATPDRPLLVGFAGRSSKPYLTLLSAAVNGFLCVPTFI